MIGFPLFGDPDIEGRPVIENIVGQDAVAAFDADQRLSRPYREKSHGRSQRRFAKLRR